VRATPAIIEGSRFTILSMRDISGEKRRQALEQVFFHDVLNTVTGLRGWAELLRLSPGGHPGAPERIERLTRHLEREIRDHRALVLAEDGTLVPRPECLRAADLLREVEVVFASHGAARGRRLEQEVAEDVELESDPALVLRVLVNMVRNAFEATDPGGTIRMGCERIVRPSPTLEGGNEELARFSVWNEGVMPPEVQARVFQRSFSTKSQHGRGFGTYSMKLLAENYLSGRVSFLSEVESGTVFLLDLPLVLAKRLPAAAS
jgi:signal transduction histidine kinase